MTVEWSDRSIDRLLAIHEYVAADSSTAASNLVGRIFDSVERLRDFPKSGRQVPEFDDPSIREIMVSSYRIVYRQKEDRIQIINVLHTRQQR